jgi:hypothetical protein
VNKRYALLLVVLGCVIAVVAATSKNASEPSISHPSGAILNGGCAGGGGFPIGIPMVVFQLGEYGNVECTILTGAPTRGVPMPSAGTLLNLQVADDASNAGSVATVYVNGLATSLTCTETSNGKCSDTTHRISVLAGDEVAATYTSTTGYESGVGFVMSFEKR